MSVEEAVTFSCQGSRLVGVFHSVAGNPLVGVVIVVGGPQYRAGSHRQFTLIARSIAGAGFPVLRFDYRGMGDSEGEPRTFDSVSNEISAAIDQLFERTNGLHSVVIVGLCDAASAAAIYAHTDHRVQGIVMANPWVRSESTEAKTYLRHYYLQRIFSPSFFRKVFSGDFNGKRAIRELLQAIRAASKTRSGSKNKIDSTTPTFIDRMLVCMLSGETDVLILLSDRDLTAREFWDLCRTDSMWRSAWRKKHVSVVNLAGADHTFSRRSDLEKACKTVVDWIDAIN